MCNVAVEAFEISLYGCLDVGREMVVAFGSMKDLVALSKKRVKHGAAHLEPPITLSFVVGGGECPRLYDCYLIAVIIHVSMCQQQQVLIVHHFSMIIREDFGPVDGALGHSIVLELDVGEGNFQVSSKMIACNSMQYCAAIMYIFVEGVRAGKDVVHAWDPVQVMDGGKTGVGNILFRLVLEDSVLYTLLNISHLCSAGQYLLCRVHRMFLLTYFEYLLSPSLLPAVLSLRNPLNFLSFCWTQGRGVLVCPQSTSCSLKIL
jgi:hypothetical protein